MDGVAADSSGLTFACLGDSITYGHGVQETREEDAWPFLLQKMLGEGVRVLNFGINGATALRDTPDSYEASGMFDRALGSGADVFLLMLGTNDTKDRYWDAAQFYTDFRYLAQSILDLRPKSLILMLPPKAFAGSSGVTAFGVSDERLSSGVVPAVRAAAEEFGLELIDLYSLTQDHPEYFLEGVHPNREGNAALAAHIAEILKTNKNLSKSFKSI